MDGRVVGEETPPHRGVQGAHQGGVHSANRRGGPAAPVLPGASELRVQPVGVAGAQLAEPQVPQVRHQVVLDGVAGAARPDKLTGEQVIRLATVHAPYPDDRSLGRDSRLNAARVDAALAPEALVAAGGLCTPVETLHEVFGIAVADRPVRDALPAFGADRGGVELPVAPRLASVAAGVGLWTLADDEAANVDDPTTPRKPVRVAGCGQFETVHVHAVTRRLRLGNAMARYAPEHVASLLKLLLAEHARRAESQLLAQVSAASTAVTSLATLGASRDLLTDVELGAVAYRSRHRMGRVKALRVILPEWTHALLRADLTRQMPGDRTTAVTDAELEEHLAVRGIQPIYTIDSQVFGEQAAGPLVGWPTSVRWWLFAEGSFLFLDGGELNIGVVRSPELNGVNSFETFAETFEAAAFRGVESLEVTSTVTSSGAVSGTVAPV